MWCRFLKTITKYQVGYHITIKKPALSVQKLLQYNQALSEKFSWRLVSHKSLHLAGFLKFGSFAYPGILRQKPQYFRKTRDKFNPLLPGHQFNKNNFKNIHMKRFCRLNINIPKDIF